MFTAIACVDKNNGIGKDGKLPWHNRDDMKWFKAYTTHKTIIMGRKTWESLPRRPLSLRASIVISNTIPNPILNCSVGYKDGATWTTFENFKLLVESYRDVEKKTHHILQENCIIGGESIYRQCFEANLVDRVILTHLNIECDCDTFFPAIPSDFTLVHTDKEKELVREYYVRV